VTSDIAGHVDHDTTAARDLALWTGRLAYADPGWTLSSGPRHAVRPAADFASRPEDAGRVIAAVHHATDALQQLAAARHHQAWIAARANRFLVQTRTLPDSHDIATPYTTAPPARIALVLTAYQEAHITATRATTAMAGLAATARAPSRTLARAHPEDSREQRGSRHAAAYDLPRIPGTIERTLLSLGIADPNQLCEAATIDHDGEQLVARALMHAGKETRRKLRSAAANPQCQQAEREP